MATTRRFRCKWCNGTGFVASGAKCWSCKGMGWYENPTSSRSATTSAAMAGLLSIGLWWIGRAVSGWSFVPYGLSLSCMGVAVVCLVIRLRGPEEQGWNGLMLIGTLMASAGILSILAVAVWKGLT